MTGLDYVLMVKKNVEETWTVKLGWDWNDENMAPASATRRQLR